jgi:magnesium-transporting ATPase (P-type)
MITADTHSRSYARLAGVFYLIIVVSGVYAIALVPSQLHVADDPSATIQNILTNRAFFLSGILGDVILMIAEIMVTVMLFFMFRSVNATLSLAAALARFAMVTVMAAMLFFYAGLLEFAEGTDALTSFSDQQRVEIAYLFLKLHDAGVWIWQVFFTVHLVILGQLVVKSGFYPRLLGWGLTIGGFGYILDSAVSFALPDASLLGVVTIALLALVTISEIGFALWLVFVGPRSKSV